MVERLTTGRAATNAGMTQDRRQEPQGQAQTTALALPALLRGRAQTVIKSICRRSVGVHWQAYMRLATFTGVRGHRSKIDKD